MNTVAYHDWAFKRISHSVSLLYISQFHWMWWRLNKARCNSSIALTIKLYFINTVFLSYACFCIYIFVVFLFTLHLYQYVFVLIYTYFWIGTKGGLVQKLTRTQKRAEKQEVAAHKRSHPVCISIVFSTYFFCISIVFLLYLHLQSKG